MLSIADLSRAGPTSTMRLRVFALAMISADGAICR